MSGNSNLADLPRTIEHRCLAYHYIKLGKSTPDLLADLPPTIEYRCLPYCYTKLGRSTPQRSASAYEWQFHLSIVTAHIGRSTGRSTPSPQPSIDALHTVTPNLADLPQICWQIYPQEASSGQEWQLQISVVTAHIGRSTGRCFPQCIMGYILWDVFGRHFGFFKKR